jgi:hypothetical protein
LEMPFKTHVDGMLRASYPPPAGDNPASPLRPAGGRFPGIAPDPFRNQDTAQNRRR